MLTIIQQDLNTVPDKRASKALSRIFNRILPSATDTGITAHAGGTQAAALPLKADVSFHEVTVCATTADSVKLPAATVGQMHFVKNSGAASLQVFGSGTNTIDSVATATGVALPAGNGEWYICLVAGNYIRLRASASTGAFTTVTATSSITSSSPSAGIGYATGAGSTVTQTTNRSAGVTINAICGTIQTDTTSLAAGASAEFTVTNSSVAIGDVVVVSQRSGSSTVAGVAGTTVIEVVTVAASSFIISVNNNSSTTAETGAIIINFAVLKAVTA